MNVQDFNHQVLPARHKLYRFAFRMLGTADEAKDVVQETMIRVWNGRDLAEVQNVEAWCMRITKNLALDKLRSRQRKATQSLQDQFDVQHQGPGPQEKTELSESMTKIDQLMALLPEKQRQVMHLRDIEGYSYQEICEMLELDMNQVKVSLFRARNAVREKLIKLNAYGL